MAGAGGDGRQATDNVDTGTVRTGYPKRAAGESCQAIREESGSIGYAHGEISFPYCTCEDCVAKDREAMQARNGEGVPLLAVQGDSDFGRWVEDFKPLLGTSPRWEGFKFIVADQLERESVGIIETGTCRKPGDWVGDGNATRVWDWILAHKSGVGVSVDVEMSSIETAQKVAPRVHCVCQDSVSFLRGYIPFVPTLVYLDSRDWGPGAEVSSCMHQVAELAAIWERLPSGCLIASDDSHNLQQGKPVLTRQLLAMLDIQPVLESYIVAWKKP